MERLEQLLLRVQSNPPKENTETKKEGTRDCGHAGHPIIRSVLDLPPSFLKDYEANQKQSYQLQKREAALATLNIKVQKRIVRVACWSFIAAAIYAAITAGQWYELRKNFALEQRAYLLSGDPTNEGGYGLLKFPIRNYGKSIARNITLDIHLGRFAFKDNQFTQTLIDRRVSFVKVTTAIVPSEVASSFIQVFTPNYAEADRIAINQGTQTLNIQGTLTYDSGFGERDYASLCYLFQKIHNRWENCSGNESVWLDAIPNSYKDVKQ